MWPVFDSRTRLPKRRGPTAGLTPSPAALTSSTVQRAQSAPNRMVGDDVTALQATMGNHAVADLLARNSGSSVPAIQAKLAVGPAGDRYEEEADRVAARVTGAMPHTGSPTAAAPASLQRTAVGPEGGAITGNLESRLRRSQSSGQSLPGSVRRALEPKLGADLSSVKAHTDQHAVQMSQELGAKAFTHGNHIYYGPGQSPNNLKLTAHEAVHTIQQGAVQTSAQRKPDEETGTPGIQRFSFTKRGKQKEKVRSQENWNRMPTSVGVSSGGVRGGAVFVNFEDSSYVLKTSGDESPGRSLFAEHVLKSVGGVETPDSIPLQKGTPAHTSLMNMLDKYEWEHRWELYQAPERWQKFKTGIKTLRGGQYILVMKNLAKMGGEGFGNAIDANDEDKGDLKARSLLNNDKLLERIGITMAVDFLMGNADRFEEMNLDNVFYMGNSDLGAIDNDAIFPKLPKEEKIQQDPHTSLKMWVKRVVRGDKYRQDFKNYEPANSSVNDRSQKDLTQGAPTARLKQRMSDFNKWFKLFFRGKLELTYNIKFLSEQQWDHIRDTIRGGVEKGMRRVESSFKGFSGMRMKSKFNKYGQKYQLNGMNERNYEWKALQVRQKFMAAMNRGMDANAAELEAYKFALSLFGHGLNEGETMD